MECSVKINHCSFSFIILKFFIACKGIRVQALFEAGVYFVQCKQAIGCGNNYSRVEVFKDIQYLYYIYTSYDIVSWQQFLHSYISSNIKIFLPTMSTMSTSIDPSAKCYNTSPPAKLMSGLLLKLPRVGYYASQVFSRTRDPKTLNCKLWQYPTTLCDNSPLINVSLLQLSEQVGTKGCSDKWKVQITEKFR